jgi:hypothetical protein
VGPLSDERVIRFIAQTSVPVALNLYEIRKARSPGGDFFRQVQKQRPAQYQGLYLVAPDGKVLASHQNFKSDRTWPQEVLADLEPGLRAFGKVKPRTVRPADPLPQRGLGARADGSACLAIFLRYPIQGIPLRELPNPTIDNLVLTATEFRELAPPRAEDGARWDISPAVSRRFHRVLGPGDEDTMARLHEVRSASFSGRVKSVEGAIAYLAYEGTIAGAHEMQSNRGKCQGQAKLTGMGVYDLRARQMLSLVWVFDSTFRSPPPNDREARPYSGVVEWRREPGASPQEPEELILFDFEKAEDLKAWTNLDLKGAGVKEAARIERSTDMATSGKHSLKITFAGGAWPTLTTTSVPDDWNAWHTLQADVAVSRPCVVGFTVLQERSHRGDGYEQAVSRWTRTFFLKAGQNKLAASLRPGSGNPLDPKRGKVVRFEIFMYNPHAGGSLYLDNIRLSKTKAEKPPAKASFAVAGTDWVLDGVNASGVLSAGAVIALGKKLSSTWIQPEEQTVVQVEEEFAALYKELKKTHPRAVLAVLRDGAKGYDPRNPDRAYAGWKDAYFSSHGPDGLYRVRAENRGRAETHEVFMRHRSPLMRVDLSSIPLGSKILAARLIVVRAGKERDPRKGPTMWVVEPCNRPWEEHEVNAFQYAAGKFWKEVGGFHWGDDPDFLPVFLAYGPGRGKVNWWDFTQAVRYWTRGDHPNHGFMLHGDSRDYMTAYTREAREVASRPAVLVIYEPK